jgi:uncharacterized protein YyaL (SSP411 family)
MGFETLAATIKQNLIVSVGYSAYHWLPRYMEHESLKTTKYEIMNKSYINIK